MKTHATVVLAAALLFGTLTGCASSGTTESQPETTTQSKPAPPEMQGCMTISDAVYDITQKLGGIGDTYTIADVTATLADRAPKLEAWSQINRDGGNLKAAKWLLGMSENARRLRVALDSLDSAGITKFGGYLASGTKKIKTFCP